MYYCLKSQTKQVNFCYEKSPPLKKRTCKLVIYIRFSIGEFCKMSYTSFLATDCKFSNESGLFTISIISTRHIRQLFWDLMSIMVSYKETIPRRSAKPHPPNSIQSNANPDREFDPGRIVLAYINTTANQPKAKKNSNAIRSFVRSLVSNNTMQHPVRPKAGTEWQN